ncbi:unnamed protein product [Ascophyllum nodosum]
MVKDGSAKEGKGFQLVRWILPQESRGYAAINCGEELGPDFGNAGFEVMFCPCKLSLGCLSADSTEDDVSQLLNLDKQNVLEIEVYRVFSEDVSAVTEATFAEHAANERMFGASIAGVFMEERILLNDAQVELRLAKKRARAATYALAAMYGPEIASGTPDPVVELNVRGTTMTTLSSTLRACPESALAARFDETKWPSDGKDFGKIDCRPSSFSKVLDVLRMRKRSVWCLDGQRETIAEAKVPDVLLFPRLIASLSRNL